jgi:hypothetical protein
MFSMESATSAKTLSGLFCGVLARAMTANTSAAPIPNKNIGANHEQGARQNDATPHSSAATKPVMRRFTSCGLKQFGQRSSFSEAHA